MESLLIWIMISFTYVAWTDSLEKKETIFDPTFFLFLDSFVPFVAIVLGTQNRAV